jgi:hypothetical protein
MVLMRRYQLHSEYVFGERRIRSYTSSRQQVAVLKDDSVLGWYPTKKIAEKAAREDARKEYEKCREPVTK